MPPPGGTRTSLAFSARLGPTAGAYGQSWGTFAPGAPLAPIGPEPVRVLDFPVGINTVVTPRAYQPFGFPQLRAFANVELVRMAIETRKDQIERLDWKIKPKDEKAARGDSGVSPRIREVEAFVRKPDGVRPFATWLRLLMEDLLALDAPSVECRRTRGGQLIGLDVVPGDTIHPMVDETGRRPRGPDEIAYQQVIKGLAWVNLSNADLIYAPRNPRPNHLYGLGPVEQVVVTINTVIRRQAAQLAYFTEGNLPAGLLNGPEGWNPDQIKEMQTWLDARLSGNTAEQAKLLWVPSGTKYQSFKENPIKDEFDEWLARVIANAFSLPPTPFIRQMNKGTAGEDQERGLEEGLEPLKLWAKRLMDGVIQDELGHPDLEFGWNDGAEVDRVQQAEIDDKSIRNGSATIDEVRDRRGEEPLPDGQGAKAMVFTTAGPVTLEKVLQDEAEPPPEPVATPPVVATPVGPDGGHAGHQHAPAPAKVAKRRKPKGSITADRPKARRAKAALRKLLGQILKRAGDEAAADVARKLRGLHKAADDTGALSNQALAAKLAAEADLSALKSITTGAYDELFDIAYDSGQLALAGIGVRAEGDLVDQVFQRAADYARTRAADLVSLDGEKNIVEATRSAIRTVIADGLEQNIGADAIADAIQASTAFSEDRADLIADSEIRMANAAGKMAGWEEAQAAGIALVKGWQVSNEGDTCDECLDNEAAGLIPLDDAFPSGADDEGDSHPNCSCVTYVEVAEDESAPESDGADESED